MATVDHPLPPRKHRTTRSSSINTSPGSKRSPSPIISALLAENPKGVKNITRKVIRRLEGLGHLEMVDSDFSLPEEEDVDGGSEEHEIEKVLYAIGQETVKRTSSKQPHVNGNGLNPAEKAIMSKIDHEIPRKLLHSSIGFFTVYLYISEANIDFVVKSLWLALCIVVPAEFLRFRSPRFERLYERVLGFLMRESEKNSINGVVWYIIGVNFVLSFYPQDVATVAILILSWADTAASTVGRLYGAYTPKLPARLPFLRLPLAPRKSVAGFVAATLTGAAVVIGFWGFIASKRFGGSDLTWTWDDGVRRVSENGEVTNYGASGPLGLLVIAIVSGLVSGIAEALELGSLDDNLTLPIISGGCIFGFLKLLGAVASWFSS